MTHSLAGWHRMKVTGQRRRWQTTPNCRCPPREHPWQSRPCNLWGWNVLEAVFSLSTGRVVLPAGLWLPRFSRWQRDYAAEGASARHR